MRKFLKALLDRTISLYIYIFLYVAYVNVCEYDHGNDVSLNLWVRCMYDRCLIEHDTTYANEDTTRYRRTFSFWETIIIYIAFWRIWLGRHGDQKKEYRLIRNLNLNYNL